MNNIIALAPKNIELSLLCPVLSPIEFTSNIEGYYRFCRQLWFSNQLYLAFQIMKYLNCKCLGCSFLNIFVICQLRGREVSSSQRLHEPLV